MFNIKIIAKSLSCISTLKVPNFRDSEITEAAVDYIISTTQPAYDKSIASMNDVNMWLRNTTCMMSLLIK